MVLQPGLTAEPSLVRSEQEGLGSLDPNPCKWRTLGATQPSSPGLLQAREGTEYAHAPKLSRGWQLRLLETTVNYLHKMLGVGSGRHTPPRDGGRPPRRMPEASRSTSCTQHMRKPAGLRTSQWSHRSPSVTSHVSKGGHKRSCREFIRSRSTAANGLGHQQKDYNLSPVSFLQHIPWVM
ncbi:uncharacterized protein B0I36DRAFT_148439 [Microdochium trichocladiopsis]|uniref:Uncharacterized protein n=1 Tax=Microdochium trichocladiopsis TaxID=1682393 RepID=A0A9P9BMD3_9PEZI|nr:uncharacterized protein B0I36DRAFT_148439 [Microdochium trichocladiopsis]KAH7025721.1 hypothetical protein B0I36DRAFT_148439 [Microdochium trichocladiopsis]